MRLIRMYSTYLVERYGEKTYRVAVDAGFTCPVRDAGRPCSYCDDGGSRAPYLGGRQSLRDQIEHGVAFLRGRYGAERFLLFFQAFSNTYAPVDTLRRVYDEGLEVTDFAGLIVATRPDCVDDERVRLLASYLDRGYDVWVELGLQTAHDATLRRIDRGHDARAFAGAVDLLRSNGIRVAAHLILGLPGEGAAEVAQTCRFVSRLGADGVKFHNLVIKEGTRIYREYQAGLVRPVTAERYQELLITGLEHLRPDVVVMRLQCDPVHDTVHVPADFPDKATFYRRLTATMGERGAFQGRHWTDHDERMYKETEDRRCRSKTKR